MCAKKTPSKFRRINNEENAYFQEKVQYCWKLKLNVLKALSEATATTELKNCQKLLKLRAVSYLSVITYPVAGSHTRSSLVETLFS